MLRHTYVHILDLLLYAYFLALAFSLYLEFSILEFHGTQVLYGLLSGSFIYILEKAVSTVILRIQWVLVQHEFSELPERLTQFFYLLLRHCWRNTTHE